MHIYVTPRGWKAFGAILLISLLASGVTLLIQSGELARRIQAIEIPALQAAPAGTVVIAPAPTSAPAPVIKDEPPVPIPSATPAAAAATPAPRPEPITELRQAASKLRPGYSGGSTETPVVAPPPQPITPTPRAPVTEKPVVKPKVAEPLFRISAMRYTEGEDAHRAVARELGEKYRVADWSDIVQVRGSIKEWLDTIQMPSGETNSLWVTHNGKRTWQNGRWYFISRFDGNKPGDYLVHASLGDNTLCLGSFRGREYRILAIRR